MSKIPFLPGCLLAVCCFCAPIRVQAQTPLTVGLNTFKTDQKQAAIGFAIQYLKPFLGLERQLNFKRSFLTLSPEINVQEGTADAFSHIIVKLSGYYLLGQTTTITNPDNGRALTVVDISRLIHLFPFAAGVETGSDFRFVNTLVEGGYIPFYQAPTMKGISDFFKTTQVGIFIQGGYKYKVDSAGMYVSEGGKEDESSEPLNEGILRLKLTGLLDTKNFFVNESNTGFGLVGKGTYWLDCLHGEAYYQLEGRFRIYLAAGKFFDLVYQKGSGAPYFNTGDQWGTALSIQF